MGPSGRVEEESMSEECDRCSFAFGYLSEMCLSGGAYVEVIMPTACKTSVIISLCSEGSLFKCQPAFSHVCMHFMDGTGLNLGGAGFTAKYFNKVHF